MTEAELIERVKLLTSLLHEATPHIPHGRYAANRCEVCGWTLSETLEQGCTEGSCSYRPEASQEIRTIRNQRLWLRCITALGDNHD